MVADRLNGRKGLASRDETVDRADISYLVRDVRCRSLGSVFAWLLNSMYMYMYVSSFHYNIHTKSYPFRTAYRHALSFIAL